MVRTVTIRQIRMLRAVVFATLCVALAATAHVSMAEAVLPVPVLAGAFAGTVGGSWLLAGRRRGPVAISGWMVTVQAALHTLFEATATVQASPVRAGRGAPDWVNLLLCTRGGSNPTALTPQGLAALAGLAPGTPVGSQAAAMPSMPGMSGMAGMSGMPGNGTSGTGMSGMGTPLVDGLSAGMLAAHLLAALACALLLWRGERAIVGLFETLRTLAGVFLPVLALLALAFTPHGDEPPAPPRRRPARTRLPRLVALSHAVVRRGPPSPALAF
ncbi:PE-PGRS family protein [Kitasatospora sp. NBC_01302]|uniref:PE-PGRS family protein n=1 Tax=Kitasatospora sp. NBC_01302 TaxID=2903575 RepID=UPI002E160776|nr:PE-PGRS family protein [Kitasatospora sp. NBC_01302]